MPFHVFYRSSRIYLHELETELWLFDEAIDSIANSQSGLEICQKIHNH